jgi:hypothetical protein
VADIFAEAADNSDPVDDDDEDEGPEASALVPLARVLANGPRPIPQITRNPTSCALWDETGLSRAGRSLRVQPGVLGPVRLLARW